jgi:hypothetical protein
VARRPVALTDGTYEARSLIASAQRCVNLYPERNPQAQAERGLPFTYYPVHGLRQLSTPPSPGYGRGLYWSTTDQLFAVIGSNVYLITPAGGNPPQFTWMLLGQINSGGSGLVKMVDNLATLVLVDGTTTAYQYSLTNGGILGSIQDENCIGGDFVINIDGFLGFNQINSRNWYTSLDNTITFDPTFVAAKLGGPDKLRALVAVHREAWLIGERTTEIWYDAGNEGGMAFSIIPGTFIQHGTCAPYSVASHDLAVFWLSQDQNGQAEVMMGENYQAVKISTPAIDWELSQYQSVTDAIGMTYLKNGHVFYMLSFPAADKTWVYDKSQQLWHERTWLDSNGVPHRIRPSCMTFAFNEVLALDWESGALYRLEDNLFTDTVNLVHAIGSAPLPPELSEATILQMGSDSSGHGYQTDLFLADWTNRLCYVPTSFNAGFAKFSMDTGLETFANAPFPIGSNTSIDSLGNPYVTDGASNYCVLQKINPADLTVFSHFGIDAGSASDPTTYFTNPEGTGNMTCVAGDANYLVSSAGQFVQIINVDQMVFAGYYSALLAEGQGISCRGAEGATATVFLLDMPHTGSFMATHLYKLTFSPGAAAYNPASWPTPNPDIAASTIGMISAMAVDAAWTHFDTINGLLYDATDGNVVFFAHSPDAVTHHSYIVKVNAATAAVIWAIPLNNLNIGSSGPGSNVRVRYGLLAYYEPASGILYCINTIAGTVIQTFTGLGVGAGGCIVFDDTSGDVFTYGNYAEGPGTAIPIEGTPSSYSNLWGRLDLPGYATVGQTNRTEQITVARPNQMQFIRSWPHIVDGGTRLMLNAFMAKVDGGRGSARIAATQPPSTDPQITLRYSTDGGETYSNPVRQSLGATGQFNTNPTWRPLGVSLGRDVVFELSWSGPDCRALLGAWLDYDPLDT